MIVSVAPHVKTSRTTKRIMLDVLISLLPATVAGIVYFGWQAFVICLIGVASAVLTEFVWYILAQKIWKNGKNVLKDFIRQFDFTSCITGLLLSLTLPASISGWYMPLLGAVFAVGVVKMLFGGTGKNIVNPAIAGRIFLFISFTAVTVYSLPAFGPLVNNGVLTTGPTQLNNLLHGKATLSPADLFLGTGVAGCIGETCKLALLIGFIYLIVRGVVKWYLPLLLIASEGLFAVALEGFDFSVFLPSILSGGLMLAGIFMATDYVTTPKSRIGNIVYFIALGLLTAGLRKTTGIEVISFCILFMNFLVFLIDLLFKVRPFGYRRERKQKGGAR